MVHSAGPFRNYQVAAPLKPLERRLARARLAAFRNYQVAAPLKHNAPENLHEAHWCLPQLSSCGPIEAISRPRCPHRRRSFRNYQVAAPLKMHKLDLIHHPHVAFRNDQVAAPVNKVKPDGYSQSAAERAGAVLIRIAGTKRVRAARRARQLPPIDQTRLKCGLTSI